VIELMSDLPDGVVGLRFSGSVSGAEYREIAHPRLESLVESEGKIRLLVVMGAAFEHFEGGALWEDLKFGLHDGLKSASKFEKTALVTDEGWARHAVELLGWMVPGAIKVFDLDSLADATEWVAR
jgi:hypothetical protein